VSGGATGEQYQEAHGLPFGLVQPIAVEENISRLALDNTPKLGQGGL
jgi:hypothetical protein